ncbi:MAG: PDZ domain-containing protein [Kiritimatiellia bacterium]
MNKTAFILLSVLSIALLPFLRGQDSEMHPPGMLGVALHDIMSEEVEQFQLPGEYGAWVKGVGANSPAAKAGILVDDVIVSYNGLRVESARALQRMVMETPAERTVELRLIRDGKALLVQPTLGVGQLSSPSAPAARAPRSLGVGIESIAPAVGQYLGLEEGVGVIVRAVKEGSPASVAGILEKDILVKLNDRNIESAQQLAEQVKSLSGYAAVLTLIRGTETQTVEIYF